MTVGLEKLVEDIKNETIIWPIENSKHTLEEEAAWNRIGAKNKMSGVHVKSIFKVLSKKYETEKLKPNTNWKLFEYLRFLDTNNEPEKEDEEEEEEDDDAPDDADLEDDGEFVELLEVNEYDDESEEEDNTSAASESAHSSKNTSIESEQPKLNIQTEPNPSSSSQKIQVVESVKQQLIQQKNNSVSKSPQNLIKPLKGIEVKKIIGSQTKTSLNNMSEQNKKLSNSNETLSVEAKLKQNYEAAARNQTQQNKQQQQQRIPEILKRKFPTEQKQYPNNSQKENNTSPPIKKQSLITQSVTIERIGSIPKSCTETISLGDLRKVQVINSSEKSASTQENNSEIKQNRTPEQLKNYVKLSPRQNGVANEKSVKKEIIGDSVQQKKLDGNEGSADIDTVLPAFFLDLYNSKKYDSFGMYVASAMNRLPSNLATKLEKKILHAIIEVNSTESNCSAD